MQHFLCQTALERPRSSVSSAGCKDVKCFHLHTYIQYSPGSVQSVQSYSHIPQPEVSIYTEKHLFFLQSTGSLFMCRFSHSSLCWQKENTRTQSNTQSLTQTHIFQDHTGTLQHHFIQFNISADHFFFGLIVQALCKLIDTGLR